MLARDCKGYQSWWIESDFLGLNVMCSRSKPRYWRLSQIINIFHVYWFTLILSYVTCACTSGSDDNHFRNSKIRHWLISSKIKALLI
jgi:hypothetical protein